MDNREGKSCPVRCRSVSRPLRRAALEKFLSRPWPRRVQNYRQHTQRYCGRPKALPLGTHISKRRGVSAYIVQNVDDHEDRHAQVQLPQQPTLQLLPRFVAAKLGVRVTRPVVRDFLDLNVLERFHVGGRRHCEPAERAESSSSSGKVDVKLEPKRAVPSLCCLPDVHGGSPRKNCLCSWTQLVTRAEVLRLLSRGHIQWLSRSGQTVQEKM